ncbi:MAG: hypothetical protein WC460_02630 [Patescibacteria group bacterium]
MPKFTPEMPQGEKENNLEAYGAYRLDLNDNLEEVPVQVLEKYKNYAEEQLKWIKEESLKVSEESKEGLEALKYIFLMLENFRKSMYEKGTEKFQEEMLETLAKEDLNEVFLVAELYNLVDVNASEFVPESKDYDKEVVLDNVNRAIANLKQTVLNLAKAKFPGEYQEQLKAHGEDWKRLDQGRSFEAMSKSIGQELIDALKK